MYATLWSGNWQILWGLLLFPVNWIPLPSPAEVQSPSDMGSYLSSAWTCFHGEAPTTLNTTSGGTYVKELDAVCASSGGSAAEWFVIYLCFNVSFNLLFLWLVKRMSATWATIATVLCLDLTSLLSMSSFLEGDEATPVTLEQYYGLVLAGIAMWIYTLRDELDQDGQVVRGARDHNEARDLICSTLSTSFVGERVPVSGAANPLLHSQDIEEFRKGRVGGECGRLTILY